MLRTRDFVAAAAFLWLYSGIYDPDVSNTAADLRLAFYVPRQRGPTDTVQLSSENSRPVLTVLDVDGDGPPEALAMWGNRTDSLDNKGPAWTVQILDLRPQTGSLSSLPFAPKVILESEAMTGSRIFVEDDFMDFMPLAVTTGHVVKPTGTSSSKKSDGSLSEKLAKNEDRTLQYFCGNDWHDAAEKCLTHCPSGQTTDCPGSEKCFADTPCLASSVGGSHHGGADDSPSNAHLFWTPSSELSDLESTPGGNLPSIFTVWSHNSITMHSLVVRPAASADETTRRKSSKKKEDLLEVKLLWHVSPLQSPSLNINASDSADRAVECYDVSVTFLDSVTAESPSQAGLLIVTGYASVYETSPDDSEGTKTLVDGSLFTLSLDALTGSTLWVSSDLKFLQPVEADLPLPLLANRGSTSSARRRSFVADNTHAQAATAGPPRATSTVDCLREYRRSLLTTSLPHQFWNSADLSVTAMHFEHQGTVKSSQKGTHGHRSSSKHAQTGRRPAHKHHRVTAAANTQQRRTAKKTWWSATTHYFFAKKKSPHARQPHLEYGRPNVLVTHNYDGVHVRALKNGHPLCHLSLDVRTLYADINHDGTLDSLQTVTGSSATEEFDDDEYIAEQKWIQDLAHRVSNPQKVSSESKSSKQKQALPSKTMCHILALSGLPTKEELFSAHLCGRSKRIDLEMAALEHHDIHGAPLLLVEPSSRGGGSSSNTQNFKGHDVISAVSTGTVSRYRGNTGRRVWQRNGRHHYTSDYPTWDDSETVLLGRIDAPATVVVPRTRPIVLAGENSVALLSALDGGFLSSAKFPQLSEFRPQLVDLNGDGTTDILVTTKDAIWGYHVTVETGTAVPIRLAVGLLTLGLMLALLRNQFGPYPGKRSTDP